MGFYLVPLQFLYLVHNLSKSLPCLWKRYTARRWGWLQCSTSCSVSTTTPYTPTFYITFKSTVHFNNLCYTVQLVHTSLYPASSIIIYPIALSLILLSYSSSFSDMVPNTQHIPSCKQAAAQHFNKISHFNEHSGSVHVHKNLQLVSTLGKINAISNITPHPQCTLILSSHLCHGLQTGLFHSVSMT